MSEQSSADLEWASEGTVSGLTNWTPATVAIGGKTNRLFLMVRSWL